MHFPLKVKKRNVILRLKEIEWVGVDRVYLAQDKNNWRALVTMVTNVRGEKILGYLRT
jgi:hypothetical protein